MKVAKRKWEGPGSAGGGRRSLTLFELVVLSAFLLMCASPLAIAGQRYNIVGTFPRVARPQAVSSLGTVQERGRTIRYKAVAGTIVLHKPLHDNDPTVSMFYVAYFKRGVNTASRPILFIYDGGPADATVGFDMMALGPQRAVTVTGAENHAPYRIVNNGYSLLGAADLVFIDAPGTGYGRLITDAATAAARAAQLKRRYHHFFSIDGDANAFARFIRRFLTRYGRWDSPKYIYGFSYGAMRTAVLANYLETREGVPLSGVIFASMPLNWALSIDGPRADPGVNLPYALALPTYAAVAWYHHMVPGSRETLSALLAKAESFGMGRYLKALNDGANLSTTKERRVARELHNLTGLPVDYLLRADVRVSGGMFRHELLIDQDRVIGHLDGRPLGYDFDPTGEEALYAPAWNESVAFAGFQAVATKRLRIHTNLKYRRSVGKFADIWINTHGHNFYYRTRGGPVNAMPDLAHAMIVNPDMKVMLNGGYFDLATPFYTAWYEMKQLPIPNSLQNNISYHWYKSGHVIYGELASLEKFHENVATFIHSTDNVSQTN